VGRVWTSPFTALAGPPTCSPPIPAAPCHQTARDAVSAVSLSNFNNARRYFPGFFVSSTFASNGLRGGASKSSTDSRWGPQQGAGGDGGRRFAGVQLGGRAPSKRVGPARSPAQTAAQPLPPPLRPPPRPRPCAPPPPPAPPRSRTDAGGASTSVAADSRSISGPLIGSTSAAAGAGTAALSQRLVDPGRLPSEGEAAAPGPVNGGQAQQGCRRGRG
jgi:hypothetical protein